MASAPLQLDSKTTLRFSRWDGLLIALAGLHGVALAEWPTVPMIAFGVWWNSNTIAHNFIHRPFFRSRWPNLLFSAYLSALLGIPQALWRDRHLAHHGGTPWRLRITPRLAVETLLVCGLWASLAALDRRLFLGTYVPGYLIGLGLCMLQGHYEHADGAISHYGGSTIFFASTTATTWSTIRIPQFTGPGWRMVLRAALVRAGGRRWSGGWAS